MLIDYVTVLDFNCPDFNVIGWRKGIHMEMLICVVFWLVSWFVFLKLAVFIFFLVSEV